MDLSGEVKKNFPLLILFLTTFGKLFPKMAYSDSSSISYSPPDFLVPEDQKDEDWYINALRYFTTYYNRYWGIYSTDNQDENLSPVERGIRYSLYYLGKQWNIDYAHVTRDASGTNLQAVWIKGKKVRQLVSHLIGNLINQLENKEVTAKSLSKKVLSRKAKMHEDLLFKYDTQAKKLFDELAQIGIEYTPEGSRIFESRDDIERFMERDWKETTEEIAINLAKDIEEKNDAETMYTQAFLDFAASNYCGIFTYVENGCVKQKKIPFYNLIWDYSPNDPFCRKSRFKGFIERMSTNELFTRYPKYFDEHPEAKQDVYNMAKDGNYMNKIMADYNMPNLNWWRTDGKSNMEVCVVTMFFMQERDTRYKKRENPYGGTYFAKLKEDSKRSKRERGDYSVSDICKAVLVGNRYLVDYGYDDNVVRDPKQKGDPELPIAILCDNTILGDGVPVIGLIAQNQDRQDFLRFKIMEMIGKDKGKNYVINGNKLGEGVNSKELVADFATMGVHVTPGTSGESDDMTNSQRMVEYVDLTLDPNIAQYINLFREEERIMEEIMNIPKIALGQQQTYVGLGTQKGTIAQATLGLSLLFKNFTKLNEIALQYAINLSKLVIAAGDSEEDDYASLVIGDRGVKWLKITKDFRFQDFLVFIKTKDIVNEQSRQRIMQYAQAWSQNPVFGIDPIDILRLEQADTHTEMINDLEYSMKQKKKAAAMAAQQQAQQAQQMQENELGAKAQMTAMKEAGADNRAEIQAQTSLTNTMIKSDKEENPTAGLPVKK